MKHYSSGLHSPSTSFPSKFWGCSSGPFIEATGDRRMHEFKRWVRVCFVDEPIRHRISILGIFTVPLDFKTRIDKRIHEIKTWSPNHKFAPPRLWDIGSKQGDSESAFCEEFDRLAMVLVLIESSENPTWRVKRCLLLDRFSHHY